MSNLIIFQSVKNVLAETWSCMIQTLKSTTETDM